MKTPLTPTFGISTGAIVLLSIVIASLLGACSSRIRTNDGSMGKVQVAGGDAADSNKGVKAAPGDPVSNIHGERFDLNEDELVSNESLRAWRIALAHSERGNMPEDEWKKQRIADEEESMKILLDLEKNHPKASYVLTMMAQVKHHFRKEDEAAEYYERAMLQNRADPILMLKLANTRMATGKIPKAIKYYRESLKADPGFTDAQIGLGKALLKQDPKDEEGRKLLEEVLEKNPNNEAAKSALQAAQ